MADKDPLDVKDLDPDSTPAPAPAGGRKGNPNRGAGGKFVAGPGGPKRQRTRKRSTSSSSSRKKLTDAQLRDKVTGLVAGVGLMVYPRDQVCGGAVMQTAPELADALVELSKESDSVRRALESLAVTSAWGGVIIAVSKLGVVIGAHHGMIPQQYADAALIATGAAPAPRMDQAAPPQPADDDDVDVVQPVIVGPERTGEQYPPAAPADGVPVVTAETVSA